MSAALRPREQLFVEAMDLLIGIERDHLDPKAQAQIRAWCGQSADHKAVWREVMEIDGMAGAVLQVAPPGARLSRRSLMLGGLALGGGLGLGAVTLPGAWRWLQSDYATRMAEVLPVSLPDGSRMTLGPRSTIALDFEQGRRRVRLLAGMAALTLRAPISAGEAPLRFSLGGYEVAAREAGFDISQDAGEISLAVSSGEAVITGPGLAAAQTVRAGQRFGIGSGGAVTRLGALPADQIGLWQEGLIMADDETIAATVARVARWHSGRVFVTDSAFAQQRVSGLYALDDPTEALRAIVGPWRGELRQISPLLTLISAG